MKPEFNIELHGTGFKNKGAHLMLCAVRQHFEPFEFVRIAANLLCGDFRQRSKAGIFHLIWIDTKRFRTLAALINRTFEAVLSLVPKTLRNKLNFVREGEIHAVLDASGFALSDQWGPKAALKLATNTRRWKKQGKKIILLPQAFGPFENPKIRVAMAEIIKNAALIFARDRVSFQYLTSLELATDKIKMAPDFTNLVEGLTDNTRSSRKACIVPNYRMVDKTSAEVRKKYVDFLALCVKEIEDKQIETFILIHETKDDLSLALTLQEKLGKTILIVKEEDPLRVKGIIGGCFLLVGSRYHALVSALCQNIPALGAGWSHKYEMLFQDYNCPEFFVSPLDPEETLVLKLEKIMSEPDRSTLINNLIVAARAQRESTSEMWETVHRALGFEP